jgi:hypothetical protein
MSPSVSVVTHHLQDGAESDQHSVATRLVEIVTTD